MSFKEPQTKTYGLEISTQTFDRNQAQAEWISLISNGFSGWTQWTSGVRRTEAKSELPLDQGVLIAGECYLGETSYKLTQSDTTWRLTKMKRLEGDDYLVVERGFIKVEPPTSNSGTVLRSDDARVKYEIFWPRSQMKHQHRQLSATDFRPAGPICARLTHF